MTTRIHTALAVMALAMLAPAQAQQPASTFTAQANRAFGAGLPLDQKEDIEEAQRGLLATLPGHVQYDFIQGAAPDTVNPSLWRQARLESLHGLFKVAEGIYQLRGYDIANMTLIAGKSGWIVVDPLTTVEAARAAIALADQTLGKRPVSAVIYTHGHVDHFGGVAGVAGPGTRIIAPEGFAHSAIAENVVAGPAMIRRAQYQFGLNLPWGPSGNVGSGLGPGVPPGLASLLAPTDIVSKTGQELVVDGVRIVFHMAPDSEAPSEFLFYLPEQKALCLSEVANDTMHNIYTLRGAKARDALSWSKYINQLLDAFPDAEIGFRSHQWPTFGKERLHTNLEHQRDMYRFIHDRALNLANNGMVMQDLSNQRFYPKALQQDFATRGYYGNLAQNLRGVYGFYLGWYDSNPATLDPLPREEMARRYVAAMGGGAAVLKMVREASNAGDYRWAVEMGARLVYAEPRNAEARKAQADALEQLGYQSENGVWRSSYLNAAAELRDDSSRKPATVANTSGLMGAMSLEMIFDALAVRIDHEKMDGVSFGVNLNFTDTGERMALELSNSVLNNTPGRVLANPSATLTLTRAKLFALLQGKEKLDRSNVEGNAEALGKLFASLKNFDMAFPMAAPANK